MNDFRRYTNQLPDVVKNLLIINALVFVATLVNPPLMRALAMYYPTSSNFEPYQIVTHLFTHGGFLHFFFNMFTLYMFGSVLERVWGAKRFLFFYITAGLGALFLFELVNFIQLSSLDPSNIDYITKRYVLKDVPVLGASGAIYGLLVAFGMLFPNTKLMLLFPPIPMKAKYFVFMLIGIELFFIKGQFGWDNVAHFAHLGGALFGFIMVKIWNKDRSNFY